MLELLIGHGAGDGCDVLGCNALHAAALCGNAPAAALLLRHGAAVDVRNKYAYFHCFRVSSRSMGDTPLQCAVRMGHASVVQLLLDHSARIEDPKSGSAIVLACSTAHTDVSVLSALIVIHTAQCIRALCRHAARTGQFALLDACDRMQRSLAALCVLRRCSAGLRHVLASQYDRAHGPAVPLVLLRGLLAVRFGPIGLAMICCRRQSREGMAPAWTCCWRRAWIAFSTLRSCKGWRRRGPWWHTQFGSHRHSHSRTPAAASFGPHSRTGCGAVRRRRGSVSRLQRTVRPGAAAGRHLPHL